MRVLFAVCISISVGLSACDGASLWFTPNGLCSDPSFLAAFEGDVDQLQVWPGNRQGYAPAALLTIQDEKHIARVKTFFMDKKEGWYVPAKQSYVGPNRMATSEYTVKIVRDGKAISYIGWGYNFLESAGCGTEVIRVLPVPDRAELLHAVFGTPIHRGPAS